VIPPPANGSKTARRFSPTDFFISVSAHFGHWKFLNVLRGIINQRRKQKCSRSRERQRNFNEFFQRESLPKKFSRTVKKPPQVSLSKEKIFFKRRLEERSKSSREQFL